MRLVLAVIGLIAALGPAMANPVSLAERILVQERLAALGHLEGTADGRFGPKTRAAIERFQREQGGSATGELTGAQLDALLGPLPLEQFQLLDDLDLPMFDYRSGMKDPRLKGIGLDVCQATCAADQSCQAFTYNVRARVCFLKGGVPDAVAFEGAISGIRDGYAVVETAAQSTGGFQRLDNHDLPYNDYRSGMTEAALKGIDLAACERQCAADGQCRAYTYNAKARVCFLKTAATEPERFAGAFSGIKQQGGGVSNGLWQTDATLLVDWARQTIRDYRPAAAADGAATPPVLLDEAEALAFAGAAPYDLKAIAGATEVRLTPGRSWELLARRGEDFARIGLDNLLLPSADYRKWLDDLSAWQSKYESARADVIKGWAPKLEQLIARLERDHGPGNPLAGYVKMDLVTALGLNTDANWTQREHDAHRARLAAILDDAVSDLARPYLGNDGLAVILQRRAAAALHRRAKPPENCETEPDPVSSAAYQRAAALLHLTETGALWVSDSLHKAAICSPPSDRARLFAMSAATTEDDVTRARTLMHLGVALAAAGDADAARRTFRSALALRRGEAYAEAFPWLREWFDDFEVVERLGLEAEVDVMFAYQFVQALGGGAERNNAAMSSYFFIARQLERMGRHQLADMYYAAIAPAWEGGPQTPALLVAAQAIDDREYGEALSMLERMLALTPPGADDGLRVEIYAALAEAAQLAGEFGRATGYAQEALLLLGGGTLPRTPQLAETARALEERVRTAQADAGRAGEQAASAVSTFAAAVEEACATGLPQPDLPASFLEDDLQRSLFLPDVGARYADCAHRQFAGRFIGEYEFASAAEQELEAYFRTLFATGSTDAALADFDLLMAVEAKAQDREQHIGWALRRNLDRVNAAVRAAALENEPSLARQFLGRIVERLDAGMMDQLIALDMAHDELASTILLLKSTGDTAGFLRLAPIFDANRQLRQLGYSCSGATCELAIELRQSTDDLDGVRDYANRLRVGMHVMMGGANTDSKDMDEILAAAGELAVDAIRLNLPATAFAYFAIAEADADAILADPLPLSSLKKISASSAYALALMQTGQGESAYAVARHLLSAARERVSTSDQFADDALLSWSRRLRDVFEVFLFTAPTGPGASFGPGEAEEALFAVQFLQATGTAATLSQRTAQSGSETGASYRRYLDLTRQVDGLIEQLGTRNASPELASRIAALREEQQALADRIRADDPDFFRFGRLQFASGALIGETLHAGEAIGTLYPSRFGTIRIWLDKGGLVADRAAIGGPSPNWSPRIETASSAIRPPRCAPTWRIGCTRCCSQACPSGSGRAST